MEALNTLKKDFEVEEKPPKTYNKLWTFLLGTTDLSSPIRHLRGHEHLLRIIWVYACSEWWELHFHRYRIPPIPDHHFEVHDSGEFADLRMHDMYERKKFIDCPLAIIDDNLSFPNRGSMTASVSTNHSTVFATSSQSEDLVPIAVNMMPFDLMKPEKTLPGYLHPYLPMILKCRNYIKAYNDTLPAPRQQRFHGEPTQKLNIRDIKNRIAYLTVDERPVSTVGISHRRGGVHVESPGAIRDKEIADKSHYRPDLCWYHPWGMGESTGEYLLGGIFLASNVQHTTAIWNTRVHDTFGDIIGSHGSLERCREMLGTPDKILNAGELVWITDRTPHESLPILNEDGLNRQLFRLVVGEIGFWFADHNTPNPTGYPVPGSQTMEEHFSFTNVNLFPSIIGT
jgi:hypothetical protein